MAIHGVDLWPKGFAGTGVSLNSGAQLVLGTLRHMQIRDMHRFCIRTP